MWKIKLGSLIVEQNQVNTKKMSGQPLSIVEYYAQEERHACGYCKSPDTNFSHGKSFN